jgi:hypothetical protein
MFDLQLWDVSVGFVLALILSNFFPRLSLVGGWLVKTGKAAYEAVKSKFSRD